MPIFCFTSDEGVTVERFLPFGKAPKRVHIEGHPYMRDYRAEQVKVPPLSGWPMPPCVGSGVNADQAQELRDFFSKHNCATEVTRDGDPIYRSKSHRARALKLRNMADRN